MELTEVFRIMNIHFKKYAKLKDIEKMDLINEIQEDILDEAEKKRNENN